MNNRIKSVVDDVFSRNGVSVDTRFQYEIASPHHQEAIVKIFTNAFCQSEPMTRYLGIAPKSFIAFSEAVTANAIQDQFSIVALDQDKVIACALVEDFANMHDAPTDFDPNFKYILRLLENLGVNFFRDKKFDKNKIAHLFITAVDQNYRKRGLSTQVNFQAMNLALQNGFDFMYSELTNIYNEKGVFNHLTKNPRRLVGACDYNEFQFEGFKPFPHLKGYAHGYLWELRENAKLTYAVNDQIMSEAL